MLNSNGNFGNLSLEMLYKGSLGKTMNNAFNIFYNKCKWIFLVMFAKDQSVPRIETA